MKIVMKPNFKFLSRTRTIKCSKEKILLTSSIFKTHFGLNDLIRWFGDFSKILFFYNFKFKTLKKFKFLGKFLGRENCFITEIPSIFLFNCIY